MALVQLVQQGKDPAVDIRLRDHVDRIWQIALARWCCPVEVVSDVSLPRWT